MCSWKTEIVTKQEGHWISNRLRFATADEARSYLRDLASRWTKIADTRVVESDDPIEHRYLNGMLLVIVPLILQPNIIEESA